VTDLHQSQHLYCELSGVVARLRPDVLAFVGDFLDCMGLEQPQLPAEECAIVISRFEVPEIVFVRGNHEHLNWLNFEIAWRHTGRKLAKLHGQAAVFGPAVLTGFPCYLGDDFAFAGNQEELPHDPSVWLPRLLKEFGPAIRTLWLMHEPPTKTPLSAPNSPVAGNSDWNRAIERFSPLLTVSGHDHTTPIRRGKWFHRVGSTLCVNVGQSTSGPLRFSLVEGEFAGTGPSLPVTMRVTAYPVAETVDILGGGK
jgi:Icc-related predicted phosphoesterase